MFGVPWHQASRALDDIYIISYIGYIYPIITFDHIYERDG